MTELIDKLLNPEALKWEALIIVALSAVVIMLIIALRDKISGVHVSRSGFEIRTTDMLMGKQIARKIEQIDFDTRKTVRRGTTALAIINPAMFGQSAEAMLVIRDANFPLFCATYENHHTRELFSDGGDVYLADKANDIWEAIRDRSEKFPGLTYDRAEALVCHWFKKILIPPLRRACIEKVEYYTTKIQSRDVSKTIKADLEVCRKKNLEYIQRIDELSRRSDIAEKSAIFYQTL